MVKRVKMFNDWEDPPQVLLDRLKAQTPEINDDNTYGDIEFVVDNTYDYAMVFNYPKHELITPPERTIGLILEPPEICEWMHPTDVRERGHRAVGRYFSFAKVPEYEWAPCIGFATTKPWILGLLPSEKLKDVITRTSSAERNVVMIASNKTYTPYHLKRRELLEAMMNSKIDVDFYGRGMHKNPVDFRVKGEILPQNKHIVIEKYPFCIDFENSPLGVLTDKFFDPVLRGTIPITNASVLLDHGVKGSYEYIDFELPTSQIIQRIREIISQKDLTCYDAPILAARKEILQGRMCLAKWIEEKVGECAS